MFCIRPFSLYFHCLMYCYYVVSKEDLSNDGFELNTKKIKNQEKQKRFPDLTTDRFGFCHLAERKHFFLPKVGLTCKYA